MINNFMLLDGEDIEYLWNVIQRRQMIFHPTVAPEGVFDYEKFYKFKRKKPFILFIDRNILSGLIKFCEQGSLRDKGESQTIGIIMAWAMLNDIAISAGPGVQERATQIKDQTYGLIELNKFFTIFDEYPMQMWLNVARGHITEIPPLKLVNEPASHVTAQYADGCDHYYMIVASMLHLVGLYRKRKIKPVDKMLDFIQWTYDNLLVSQYIMTYAVLLLTNQEHVKAPKDANSNDIARIAKGCENQAWDITYLSNWSTLYSNTDKYKEEFLFATNDVLLKHIFVNAHGKNGFNGLMHTVFPQKDYDRICDLIETRQDNRVKPDFGSSPNLYFYKLIDKEKQRILKSPFISI